MNKSEQLFVTHITDCGGDPNAELRLKLRTLATCGVMPEVSKVNNSYEGATLILDALDSIRRTRGRVINGIVFGNVASRKDAWGKWLNGTPFGYTYVTIGECKILIMSTLAGYMFSFVKKFGLLTEPIRVLDIPNVMDWAVPEGLIEQEDALLAINTQFRSFEFQPEAGNWIYSGEKVPVSEEWSSSRVPDMPEFLIAYVDKFGNCKTTLTDPEQIKDTIYAHIPYTQHLADVPKNEARWVAGSSGWRKHRLLEIVINGDSAAEHFKLGSGKSLHR